MNIASTLRFAASPRFVLALAALSAACLGSAQSYKGFPRGYCTYYAAQQFDRFAPYPGVNWRGNAGQWLRNASNAGWSIQTSVYPGAIREGTIIVWNDGGFGHVAIVRAAYSNGVTFDEMNWGTRMVDPANGITDRFNQVDRRFLTFAQILNRGSRGQYKFQGYVLPRRR